MERGSLMLNRQSPAMQPHNINSVCKSILYTSKETQMNENSTSHKDHDHTREAILAATIVTLTCILSCAAVVITLILRTS